MLTMCKFKSGRSGMPAAVFRSFSRPYSDRESHANPLQNLHQRWAAYSKKKTYCGENHRYLKQIMRRIFEMRRIPCIFTA